MNKEFYLPQLETLFRSFDPTIKSETVKDFLKIVKLKTLTSDSHFLEVGSSDRSFGFILQGLFKFYYTTFEGKEFIQAFQKENNFMLSYYPVMTGKPSPFGIQALEDSLVLVGSYEDLEAFERHKLWSNIAQKFYQLNFIKKVEREFDLLLHDTKTRYFKFLKEYPDLAKRLTKQQIAMYLGMTPVSLSRIINAK